MVAELGCNITITTYSNYLQILEERQVELIRAINHQDVE